MSATHRMRVPAPPRTLGNAGYVTTDPALAAYLVARGCRLCEVQRVGDHTGCDDWDHLGRDPGDPVRCEDHVVFTFLESRQLLRDVQNFEEQPSGTNLAEVIEKARKR